MSKRQSATPPANRLRKRRKQALQESRKEYLERRRHLVRTAVLVFHAKGFSDTTLADIAEAADIDRASIYYYFENKAELFRHAVVEDFLADVREVEAIAAGSEPVPEKLRLIVATLMANFGRHITYVIVKEEQERWPPLERVDASYRAAASRRGEPWLAEVVEAGDRFFNALRNVISAGLRDGSLQSTLGPGVLAQSVIGLVTWTNRWYEPGSATYTPRELADATTDLLLDGLRARRSARTRS